MNKLCLKKLLVNTIAILIVSFSSELLTSKIFAMTKLELTENIIEANKLNEHGQNSVFLTYKKGYIKVAKSLEKIGAKGNINSQDKYGKTPLFYAYLEGKQNSNGRWDLSLAEELIKNGAYHYSIASLDFNGRNPAFCACIAGKLELAKKLLELSIIKEACMTKGYFDYEDAENNPLNLIDYLGRTPIFESCINGKLEIVSKLIINGANIYTIDKSGKKPIDYAKEKGHIKIVELLEQITQKEEPIEKNEWLKSIKEELDDFKDLDIQESANNNGANPIEINVDQDHEETQPSAPAFLDEKKEVDKEWHKLFISYCSGDFNLVDKILKDTKNDPNINQEDEIGQTPIFYAIFKNVEKTIGRTESEENENNLQIKRHVEELVKRGAKVNHKNKIGQTPMLFALSRGLKEVVKILKENGAEKCTPEKMIDEIGQNPIYLAYTFADFKAVKFLKGCGFKGDINMQNYRHQSPLFCALMTGKFDVAKKLLNAKNLGQASNASGNINSENKLFISPLMHSYLNGDIEAAEKLKNATKYGFKENAKGDVLTKNSLGRSALFNAIACGYSQATKILNAEIEKAHEKLAKENKNYKKPDPLTTGIYETDLYGWTPLHYACSLNSVDSFKKITNLLSDKNSFINYINKKNKEGYTALDVAIDTQQTFQCCTEIITLLQANGAKAEYYKDFNVHMKEFCKQ